LRRGGITSSATSWTSKRYQRWRPGEPVGQDAAFEVAAKGLCSKLESPNRTTIQVQLRPLAERQVSSKEWIGRVRQDISAARIAGHKMRLYTRGIRGIRINRGDDDLTLRIKGPDMNRLETLAEQAVERLEAVVGLRNLQHSNEEVSQELSMRLDQERAASFGLEVDDVGKILRFALGDKQISDFIAGDRSIDILLRLDREEIANPGDLESLILFSNSSPRVPLRLGDIAQVDLVPQPSSIMRDRQQRVVEITASLDQGVSLQQAIDQALAALADLELPPGYVLYEAGGLEALKEGRDISHILLGLALFLVLVVMAV
jgi:multidrug efflux pump subunit AcrB